jgi:hypothetical protein
MPRPKTEYEAFQLRVPPELHQKLKEATDTTDRSMNAEIVHRLVWTFDPRIADAIDLMTAQDEEQRRRQEYLGSIADPELAAKISDQIDAAMKAKAEADAAKTQPFKLRRR